MVQTILSTAVESIPKLCLPHEQTPDLVNLIKETSDLLYPQCDEGLFVKMPR